MQAKTKNTEQRTLTQLEEAIVLALTQAYDDDEVADRINAIERQFDDQLETLLCMTSPLFCDDCRDKAGAAYNTIVEFLNALYELADVCLDRCDD